MDPMVKRYEEIADKAYAVLGPETFAYYAEDEPESHVYSAYDEEGAYDDPDEYREVVLAVGDRDLDDKIRYWERVLDRYGEEE